MAAARSPHTSPRDQIQLGSHLSLIVIEIIVASIGSVSEASPVICADCWLAPAVPSFAGGHSKPPGAVNSFQARNDPFR